VHHDPPADRTIPALHARDVTKRYGEVTALEGASLLVEKGTSVALVGESGSGKTTLLRCFNRMIDPDDGRVEVGGWTSSTRDPVGLRRALGYVQQDGGLLPHWTVLRNTALVPWLEGRRTRRSGRARSWSSWASPRTSSVSDTRGSCREGSGNERHSLVPSLQDRRCCCWTNRSVHWTR
jgi:ABC-type Fe3+/spermidine/putrescine transport system ATPase subunit